MANSAIGSISRIMAFRIGPNKDIVKTLIEECERNNIKSGIILTAIGSLQKTAFFGPVPVDGAKFGYGYGKLPNSVFGKVELLNAQGTISHDENGNIDTHMHFTVSDPDGNAFGGHVTEGNISFLTVEIVVGIIDDIDFVRRFDNDIELPVLTPEKKV